MTHATQTPPEAGTAAGLLEVLAGAAALEHHLACALSFAAWAVDTRAGDPGRAEQDRGEETAAAARAHRRLLAQGADRHLAAVVQIANLSRALGGALTLDRPRRRDLLAALTDALLAQAGDPGQGDPGRGGSGPLDELHAELTGRYAQVAELLSVGAGELLDAGAAQAPAGIAGLQADIVAVRDPGDAAAALALLAAAHQPLTVPAAPPPPGAAAGPVPLHQVVTGVALAAGAGDATLLVDARTRAVAELFSASYGLALTLLGQMVAGPPGWSDDGGAFADAAERLLQRVVRPLGEALTRMPVHPSAQPPRRAGPTFADGDPPAAPAGGDAPLALLRERVWELAVAATAARVASGAPPEIQEAAAALQALAIRLAAADGPGSGQQRRADLASIQAALPQGVQPEPDGPYLVTNAEDLQDWLGQPLATTPQLALCRCGASGDKPYCDGSHARVDFTDTKSDQRLEDRRDVYRGQQVVVLDNRGTCAHSGFCTDRLNTVFHLGEEPFVTPSGARMDEIIRAVRACPSGALSYALSSHECRQEVDHQDRAPAIEVSRDGPYRVTGDIALTEVDGSPVARNEGASQEHYSLCRCGRSQNKPFCSGMHWYADFHDPVPDPDREPTIFEWAGGLPALLRMTRIFYEKHVPEDPLIGPLFAEMSPDHPERVARWLGEVFGGPKCYSEMHGGYSRMLSQHVGKGISEEQRGRWVALMSRSADEAGIPRDAEFRSTFASYIEWGSRLAVENSQQTSRPPPKMPMPSWNWGTAGPPTGRVSSLAPAGASADEPAVLPADGEAVGFDRHVRTFFRQRDRQSMRFAFDLAAFDDVAAHATEILARVRDGSMPCDGAWPPERVDALARWIDTGMAP